jgi:hypothetical protein
MRWTEAARGLTDEKERTQRRADFIPKLREQLETLRCCCLCAHRAGLSSRAGHSGTFGKRQQPRSADRNKGRFESGRMFVWAKIGSQIKKKKVCGRWGGGNSCIWRKRKFVNQMLVYWGITVFGGAWSGFRPGRWLPWPTLNPQILEVSSKR